LTPGAGKTFCIDLSRKTVRTEQVAPKVAAGFLGGSGLAFRLAFAGLSQCATIDPLGPDNPLVVAPGLLTGTPALAGCKASLCARSPLTGMYSESTVGGYLGAQLARAGIAAVIITGRAEVPTYLWIKDDSVEFRDASELWGKDTYETAEAVGAATDSKAETACIGPAGENGVLFAAVMVGGADARAAGRTGMGAVMGSKNLKALAVRGTGPVSVADRERLTRSVKSLLDGLKENTRLIHDYGTAGGVEAVENTGDLPIKNWRQGNWKEGAGRICGQAFAGDTVGHYACFGCPIRCGKEVRLKVGPNAGTVAHGPEYETLAAFGSMVLNDDIQSIFCANDLCNRLGLDTITCGAVIALAMEADERGLLSGDKRGGLDLSWGNGETVVQLIQDIAARRGLGDLLADGAVRAAQRIGGSAHECVVAVKGLEMGYHDPRAYTSMAVAYATGSRGACHLDLGYYVETGAFDGKHLGLRSEWEPHGMEDKALLARRMQDFMTAYNSLGLCKFLGRAPVTPEVAAEWVSAVTGRETDAADIMLAGERAFNLKRVINCRLGVSRARDWLPLRLLTLDRGTGGAAGSLPHLGPMLAEYYADRGWDEFGIPTAACLERLGLADTGS